MHAAKYLKRTLITPLLLPTVGRLLRPTLDATVSIFMLHRFDFPDLGVTGHSARLLARNLAYLRKEGFEPVSLADVAMGRTTGVRRPQVAFTVDDGYTDFLHIALPIFTEYDCPVSVFLATGVWDRQCWYWNDVISYAFAKSLQRRLTLSVEHVQVDLTWEGPREALRRGEAFNESLKTVSHEARRGALGRMLEQLSVELPATPPPEYAPMTWEDARRAGQTGLVTFGPHSVTHPVLPSMRAEESRQEIVNSWQRLQSADVPTVPLFVYPFGAYSSQEVDALADTNLRGALTTEHRYAAPDAFGIQYGRRRFAVSRLTYEEDALAFLQATTGLDRIKLGIRMGRQGWRTVGDDV